MICHPCTLKNENGQDREFNLIAFPDLQQPRKLTVILDCPGGATVKLTNGDQGGGMGPPTHTPPRVWQINKVIHLQDAQGKDVTVRVQAYEYDHPGTPGGNPQGRGPKVRLDQEHL